MFACLAYSFFRKRGLFLKETAGERVAGFGSFEGFPCEMAM